MAGILALGVGYVLSQFYRAFLAVLAPALTVDLGVDAGVLSRASGVWFLAFALMQFPVGLALDRLGPRRTGGWLLLLAGGGGAALFASAQSGGALIAAMALIGIGCSPVLMANFYLFARLFAPRNFATLTGVTIGVGSLGNIVGAAPLAYAAEAYGWRPVVWAVAALTVAVALAALALVRDPPRVESAEGDRGLGEFLTLLRMPAFLPIFPLMLVSYAPSAGVRGLWIGPYLGDAFGMEITAIGTATLWMAVAMAASSFLFGFAERAARTPKWINVTGNAVSAAACLALAAAVSTEAGAVAALVVVGLTGLSYPVLLTHARLLTPAHLVGRSVTLMNFFGVGGVGLAQIVTGAVVEAAASPADPAAAYRALFLFYAAIVGGSVAVYLFSRDVRA